MRTSELIEKEIVVAQYSARRATRAVALFFVWSVVTALGPDILPAEGWNLWVSASALAAYSLLTVGSLIAVFHGTRRFVRTGAMRSVVSSYLAPFWMVAAGSLCTGCAVWASTEGRVEAAWLGLGTFFTLLTAAYALARHLEVRELRRDRDQIAHAPAELKLGTFRRELHARLEAAQSIRLD